MEENNNIYSQGQPVPTKKRVPGKVLGIVSFACGITGLATSWYAFVGLCFSIAAIITGAIAKKYVADEHRAKRGMTMGIIGAAISTVALIVFILLMVHAVVKGDMSALA